MRIDVGIGSALKQLPRVRYINARRSRSYNINRESIALLALASVCKFARCNALSLVIQQRRLTRCVAATRE